MTDDDVLGHLNIKLMAAEEELRMATGAIKASKFICSEMDAFLAKVNEELLKAVQANTTSIETAATTMRWLSRARQQLNESSSKISSSHAERRGEVESLRWMASSLVASNEEEVVAEDENQRQAPEA